MNEVCNIVTVLIYNTAHTSIIIVYCTLSLSQKTDVFVCFLITFLFWPSQVELSVQRAVTCRRCETVMNMLVQFTTGRLGLGAFVLKTRRPPQATQPEPRVPV